MIFPVVSFNNHAPLGTSKMQFFSLISVLIDLAHAHMQHSKKKTKFDTSGFLPYHFSQEVLLVAVVTVWF